MLCCGTVWGRPFSTSVQPPRTCLESKRLSLDQNFRAKEGGKENTSPFFSFLWLIYVANTSARVNVPKLEPEEKKVFALSLCKFSRNNSSGNAWYAGYPMIPYVSSPVNRVLRWPLCEKRSGARGGRLPNNINTGSSTNSKCSLYQFDLYLLVLFPYF